MKLEKIEIIAKGEEELGFLETPHRSSVGWKVTIDGTQYGDYVFLNKEMNEQGYRDVINKVVPLLLEQMWHIIDAIEEAEHEGM